MSTFLFNAIKVPDDGAYWMIDPRGRLHTLDFDDPRQCPIRLDQLKRAEGESLADAASISSTCFDVINTNLSKCSLSGLSHGPIAKAQFSTVTGLPATKQASTALEAIPAAVTVSRNMRFSSSVMAVLLWCKSWIESAAGYKGDDA